MAAAKTTTTAKSAEAKATATEFEFKGATFVIPAPLDLSDDVLDVIEDGGGERAIARAIVGQEQWATYKGLRCTIGEFNDFLDLVSEAAGFGDAGN
ncbi:hypothetical protein DWB77_02117 [Streptomyces hundungensis]|uniref:Uncharacterized protein n=1 Tax=Streptomyces hundungensis TaxID=1077946 RepID=A0A387HH67_9ACTN|nr:hypothetical protein [Streptomyces hundungensis]AYG79997.1 hypothetical protein DWB77_02117 [Streptomyces hundungensis]